MNFSAVHDQVPAIRLLQIGEAKLKHGTTGGKLIEIARRAELGFILESATWRANPDWGTRLGYSEAALANANRLAIEMLAELRSELETQSTPLVISGCVGPRGDGYRTQHVGAAEARDYHAAQIGVFARSAADLVSAITMTHAEEAVGIALAARAHDMPVVLSFTLETDGRLPTGQSLGEAIEQVDAATDGYPTYYMINCAHPAHFEFIFEGPQPWLQRVRGLRANASRRSHAELDAATELDAGDPHDLGQRIRPKAHKDGRLNFGTIPSTRGSAIDGRWAMGTANGVMGDVRQ
jgi:S-methylmethionine-dependent homocysteine/selenocysteine methylase